MGREDTVCQGPFLRHCCVSLQLCLCQGLWLHGLAGLGVSDYGFPVLRFERQGLESGLGEFCHKSLYLVDGISCIGVGLGEFDVYFQGLFQGCGYRLTTHAGVLRGDGLHDNAAVSAVAGASIYFTASTRAGNTGVLESALSSLFCVLAEGLASSPLR